MIERKFWIALAAVCAAVGVIQLPWAPSRFGGIFFLALAVGCAGEWFVLRLRDRSRACRVLAMAGRALFMLFVLSFAAIQLFVIQAGMHTDTADTQADYYLVLGALVNPDGQPSAALTWPRGVTRRPICWPPIRTAKRCCAAGRAATSPVRRQTPCSPI